VRNVPLGQAVEAAVYFTTRQYPFRELILAVRASEPSVAMAAVRTGLKIAAPNVPMAKAQTWGERFAARTAQSRLLMTILVFLGCLAGLLAAIGVYGLLSWSVALRTRELAIRLTLGARPLTVGTTIIRQSIVLLAVGLGAGLLIMYFARNALTRVLYDIAPHDMSSTAIASAVLVAAALAACIPPAIRAMNVDPVTGLRAE
jgi:ABC-type antimicrobial peptide transport system permease subunit